MTAVKSFNKRPAKTTPSVRFELGPRTWACRPANQVPWWLIRDITEQQAKFAKRSEGDELTVDDAAEAYVQTEQLLRGLLMPEDVEPFFEMVRGPDSPLTAEVMNELIPWVAERVLNRPTERSRPSQPGSRTKRAGSRGSSSSPATRRARTA